MALYTIILMLVIGYVIFAILILMLALSTTNPLLYRRRYQSKPRELALREAIYK